MTDRLEDKRGTLEILIWIPLWCVACLAAMFTADSTTAITIIVVSVVVMWLNLNRLLNADIARLRRKRERLQRQIEHMTRLRGDE